MNHELSKMTSNGIPTNSGNSVGSDTLGNSVLYSGSTSLRPSQQSLLRSSHQRSSPLFRKVYPTPSSMKKSPLRFLFIFVCAFLFGALFSASVLLNFKVNTVDTSHLHSQHCFREHSLASVGIDPDRTVARKDRSIIAAVGELSDDAGSILRDLQILVVIVSFDFSQIPHLEEVLQGYHDVCVAGAHVDVIVHATVPYPVTLMDLWNTRLTCPHFSVTVVLKPQTLRLFLVDEHRKTFYDKVHQYDLFIYTEDDIRLTPTAVAAYMMETQRIESILSQQKNSIYRPSDFNVGIVRYEYNYPTNVIMDDNTRHATQNVTRVYWEHSGLERPVVGHAVKVLTQPKLPEELLQRYITMKNHHQGMYLATRELLLAWKDRGPSCDFSNARFRPGTKGQPSEGTQRVWMSSQMLYGSRHCGVHQVLPKDSFGTLTLLHLPNKNYRRVGKYRNRQFADGTEVFELPHESLLTAMELHLSVRKELPSAPKFPYRGIRMIDEVTKDRTPLLERRMQEYEAYVKRGGVLSDYDMTKTLLVEDE